MPPRRNPVGRSGPPRTPALEALEDRTLLSSGLAAFEFDLSGLAVRSSRYDPEHVLVKFRDAPITLPGTALGQALGLVPGLYEVQLDGVTVEQALAAYRADPRVLSAEPDYLLSEAGVPTDPRFADQWDLRNTGQAGGKVGADIHATGAWDVTRGNRRIIVSVMDTGIDYNHPDLYQNIWLNQAEIPTSRRANLIDVDGDGLLTFADLNDARNQGPFKITDVNGDGRIDGGDVLAPMRKDAQGKDTGQGGWADGISEDGDTAHLDDLIGWNSNTNTNNPLDDNRHGTHVAGTIGAMGNNALGVAGIAWNVQLMPIKFMNSDGQGSIGQFIAGLNYAVAHGAKISNNSWTGAPFSQNMIDAIANARTKGHIVVAAAGNGGTNNDTLPVYPANIPGDNVVAVAVTDHNDNLASFSNYGPTSVQLAAPGVDIVSTLSGGGYGTMSGTSMATPHVTGVLALVWGQHPDWNYSQVIQQVLKTVDKLPSLTGKVVTGGRVNAAAAVGAVVVTPPPPHVVSATFNAPTVNVLGSARLTFDRAMDVSSFTPADVTLSGPSGQGITVTSVQVVAGTSNKAFDIDFANQSAPGTYTLRLSAGVKDTTGVVNQAYQATYTINSPLTFTSAPSVLVPPNTRMIVLLLVDRDLTVGDLNVRLNITAPRDSTLYIHLQGPDGTNVVLANHVGGTGQNFNNTLFDDQASVAISSGLAPFSGTYRPAVALSYFNGKHARGYWKLWVEDRGGPSASKLNSWSLIFTAPALAKTSALEGAEGGLALGMAEMAADLQGRRKGVDGAEG